MSIYVLMAVAEKRLNLDSSLYTLQQILSDTLFEKVALRQVFPGGCYEFP